MKKVLLILVIIGIIVGGIFGYLVYDAIFSPNTKFADNEAYVFIPTGSTFEDAKKSLDSIIDDKGSFEKVAEQKGYTENVKAGKYRINRGMNNNEIINSLRSQSLPVRVAFNNQETLADLAGRISSQIEADSMSLLTSFEDLNFLKDNGFNEATKLTMYLPNSYEFFWNTSANKFRDRMLSEYKKFWSVSRLKAASDLNLRPDQVVTLASIVQKETAKVDERPRVAGLYLNRLKDNMALQADPTVIFALKKHTGNFDTIIKRVLYKDLELDSPYNTYKYSGLPPGPITMPDISAIDAVLSPEKHEYYYMVANVEDFGYHKFAKSLAQHNRNKEQYIRWINTQKINR